MKKVLFLIAVFFLNIPVILAESDAYLSNLEIIGYELSPEFNQYNNSYSVNIDAEDTKLNINYELEDQNAEVEVFDNDLITEEQHIVTIKVTNNDAQQVYKIYVNKNVEQITASVDNELESLNIPKKNNKKLIISIISICWLVIVVLLGHLIFGHKKKNT